MLKKYLVSLICLTSAIISGLLYKLSPATIATNGLLQEAFGFIPLMYSFLLLAVITFAIVFVKEYLRQHK